MQALAEREYAPLRQCRRATASPRRSGIMGRVSEADRKAVFSRFCSNLFIRHCERSEAIQSRLNRPGLL
ncbi:MAG: hypothetical protein ACRECB_05300, partial [Novosphingobium sp.]